MSVGHREMNAPDEKPNIIMNTRTPAAFFTGDQIARQMMAERKAMTIMTLKRPNLSAAIPGMMRPKMLKKLVSKGGLECVYINKKVYVLTCDVQWGLKAYLTALRIDNK